MIHLNCQDLFFSKKKKKSFSAAVVNGALRRTFKVYNKTLIMVNVLKFYTPKVSAKIVMQTM